MRCTIPTIIDRQPAALRSFRAFASLTLAFRYIERHPDANCTLAKRCYGDDKRDVRYVVNFTGSVRKQRVTLAKARLIMWHGMTTDRHLPVVIS